MWNPGHIERAEDSVSETADQRTRQTEESEFLHGLRGWLWSSWRSLSEQAQPPSPSPSQPTPPWLFGPPLSDPQSNYRLQCLKRDRGIGSLQKYLGNTKPWDHRLISLSFYIHGFSILRSVGNSRSVQRTRSPTQTDLWGIMQWIWRFMCWFFKVMPVLMDPKFHCHTGDLKSPPVLQWLTVIMKDVRRAICAQGRFQLCWHLSKWPIKTNPISFWVPILKS